VETLQFVSDAYQQDLRLISPGLTPFAVDWAKSCSTAFRRICSRRYPTPPHPCPIRTHSPDPGEGWLELNGQKCVPAGQSMIPRAVMPPSRVRSPKAAPAAPKRAFLARTRRDSRLVATSMRFRVIVVKLGRCTDCSFPNLHTAALPVVPRIRSCRSSTSNLRTRGTEGHLGVGAL
jgi:hypothetical protein